MNIAPRVPIMSACRYFGPTPNSRSPNGVSWPRFSSDPAPEPNIARHAPPGGPATPPPVPAGRKRRLVKRTVITSQCAERRTGAARGRSVRNLDQSDANVISSWLPPRPPPPRGACRPKPRSFLRGASRRTSVARFPFPRPEPPGSSTRRSSSLVSRSTCDSPPRRSRPTILRASSATWSAPSEIRRSCGIRRSSCRHLPEAIRWRTATISP